MCSDFPLNHTGHAYPLKCRVWSSTVNGVKCTRYMIRLGISHRPTSESKGPQATRGGRPHTRMYNIRSTRTVHVRLATTSSYLTRTTSIYKDVIAKIVQPANNASHATGRKLIKRDITGDSCDVSEIVQSKLPTTLRGDTVHTISIAARRYSTRKYRDTTFLWHSKLYCRFATVPAYRHRLDELRYSSLSVSLSTLRSEDNSL